ncbi:MAG: hypothetical protein QQW96_14475 [Tychonema bourrellyi B0820]|uniref:Uncharacterized protein n=1 Tax=Tychonema bourrellyi FEM_GT703 TaxID=2040638 RepID=A0A2G4EYZ0_9CYAN|nr:hypothetical protein [Tychonema bourrellyi]MDQ2098843.1 hypothetical protein [Tychonema bourrellyi B0820]PHX54743.1 hypothetical protein CP500_014475 [Tychonema bourrellyi FEM_GT703]
MQRNRRQILLQDRSPLHSPKLQLDRAIAQILTGIWASTSVAADFRPLWSIVKAVNYIRFINA